MNSRRKFFKNLGIGTVALVVAPKIIAENIKEDPTNPYKILKKPFDVPESDLNDDEKQFFSGVLRDKDLVLDNKSDIRVNDVLLITNGDLEQQFIATEIDTHKPKNVKVVCFNVKNLVEGKVKVYRCSRKRINTKHNSESSENWDKYDREIELKHLFKK